MPYRYDGKVDHQWNMVACCEQEKFDKIAGMTCSTDLVKQLDKVHAALQALMQELLGKK
jgi:hypothetical protein